MMDTLKKLNEISLQNEALYDSIFGHKAPNVKVIKKNDKGNYFINGNFVYTFATDGTANPYVQSTWSEPDMKWITEPDVKFKATYIIINKRKIEFQGTWSNGRFAGSNFSGDRSYFEKGGVFQGEEYSAPNENFKAPEENFISGRWIDYENGILGKANYKDKQENVSDIALVSIPVGWTVNIAGDNKKEINLKVLKKIDNVSTTFEFEVMESKKKYSVLWETIRKDYLNNGFVVKGKSFDLLGSPEYSFSSIEKISLLNESPAVKTQNFNVLDFTKDKSLAGILPGKIEVVLSDESDIERINLLQRKITDGTLGRDISILKNLIQKGEVNGYVDNSLYYLKQVFNNNKGSVESAKIIASDSKIMAIMKELNDLLELVSFNSQVLKEVREGAYGTLVKNLKAVLAVDKYIKPIEEKPLRGVNIIDFSKDKNLAKFFSLKGSPIRFQIFIKSEDAKTKAAKLQKSINDGTFYRMLIHLRHFIESGAIDGYSDDSLSYLKPLFNNVKGQKTVFDKKVKDEMSELNDVIWLISFNSIIIKEERNQTLILITNILKKILGIDKFVAKANNKEDVSIDDSQRNKEHVDKLIQQL